MKILKNINIDEIIKIAQDAGVLIMNVYKKEFKIFAKQDTSPVTEADLLAHKLIINQLKLVTPNIPVLSEESNVSDFEDRLNWETYWLVDPLDGTKEFLKKNDEFTVNIALIHKQQPILGVIQAPALDTTYWGYRHNCAFKKKGGKFKTISVRKRPQKISEWVIVGSRSHQSTEFKDFIKNYPGAKIISMGSSLKFCLIAEGIADIYPRLGLTSEWDTAAAQAIVEAAKGQVLKLPEKKPLKYNTNPSNLLNPNFLVCGDYI